MLRQVAVHINFEKMNIYNLQSSGTFIHASHADDVGS